MIQPPTSQPDNDAYNQRWVLLFAPRELRQGFAITIGQRTYYSVPKDRVDSAWRAHENQHKAQFQRLGLLRFLLRYAMEYLEGRFHGLDHFAAYIAMPLEHEAIVAAANEARRRTAAYDRMHPNCLCVLHPTEDDQPPCPFYEPVHPEVIE